jgi:hypothetical protein
MSKYMLAQDGEPAKDGVGAAVAGDAAVASRKVSLILFEPLSSGQSLESMLVCCIRRKDWGGREQ